MVPILDAEIVNEVPLTATEAERQTPLREEAAPSWQSPPPIRRPARELAAASPEPPVELFDLGTPVPGAAYDLGITPASKMRQRVVLLIIAMVVIAGFVVAFVTVRTLNVIVQTEGDRSTQAQKDYKAGKYGRAAQEYQSLIDSFPQSKSRAYYQFLADLSRLREQVYAVSAQPREAFARWRPFLDEHKSDAQLKTYRSDIHQTLRELGERLTIMAEENHDPAILEEAKQAFAESTHYPTADRRGESSRSPQTRIAQAETNIRAWLKRQRVVDQLAAWLADKPSLEAVKEGRALVKQQGYEEDAEVKDLLAKLDDAARTAVRYVACETALEKGTPEVVEPSLLITPLVAGRGRRVGDMGGVRGVVPVLARGVLYALDQDTGELHWAVRVGIDTSVLPVRLPATPVSPELFLVLSADRNLLMALSAQDGSPLWQHQLSAPCLGRPVVVGRRAYVPTYDGRVHEIETIRGNLLGYFELGQPLTVGGVWHEGTNFLYCPGDSEYVYVLDIGAAAPAGQPAGEKKCVAILQTGHPSGSLRSAPFVINRIDPHMRDASEAPVATSYLVLSQSDGLEHMKLRVFGLPIDRPDAPPLLQSEPQIRGWSWFQPCCDGEKLACVTDAGVFGLFGINQVRNDDPPLFAEFPGGLALQEKTVRIGRAQVVHAWEDDFWILAHGELQRMHFDRYRRTLVPLWATALPLGSPLHPGQMDESGKILFVVTQDLSRHICLATAVTAEDGSVRWQRQLGVECQGEPLLLDREVVLLDRGGGLFAFDGGNYRHQPDREWQLADPFYTGPFRGEATAESRSQTPVGEREFVPVIYSSKGPDGASVYAIVCHGGGRVLTLRRYQPSREGQKATPSENTMELPAPLAGTPALEGPSVLMPLADGTLQRWPLDGGPRTGGPDWRSGRADEGAPGHVVPLGSDEFLTTNGSRGLTHWRWPQRGLFKTVPENKVPTVELPARIVAAPLVLAGGSAELHVCVADADGNITLLRGSELRTARSWTMGGKITTGPYLVPSSGTEPGGQRIACVVDRRRLVLIDPTKDGPAWEYRTAGEGIVGQPRLAGTLLIVADLSGHFVGLEPTTGRPVGPGYTLKARVTPLASPTAYGNDEAIVPLSDGTLFVLALRELRDPRSSPKAVMAPKPSSDP
jgi:hypothetical protein